jgi:site-specific recombinase
MRSLFIEPQKTRDMGADVRTEQRLQHLKKMICQVMKPSLHGRSTKLDECVLLSTACKPMRKNPKQSNYERLRYLADTL